MVAGNFLFALDDGRKLWRCALDTGKWGKLPGPPGIIQNFTAASFDEALMVIVLNDQGKVFGLHVNSEHTGYKWLRIGEQINFTIDPASRFTCASAIPGRLDLFAAGTDGKLYNTWWTAKDGWEQAHHWESVMADDQPFTIAPSQHLQVISRVNGLMEVYVTGTDNHAWKNWYS